jgi:hypothetical protein
MHGPVRDKLEDLLAAGKHQPAPDHLAFCQECLSEVESMKWQSRQVADLRAPELMEPAPGFYARVLQKIEESEIDCFWAFFVDSPFSKRLAAASLTVALALGSYVFTLESREQRNMPAQTLAALGDGLHYDFFVTGSPDQQRDAVLDNFAAHQSSEGQVR